MIAVVAAVLVVAISVAFREPALPIGFVLGAGGQRARERARRAGLGAREREDRRDRMRWRRPRDHALRVLARAA